MSEKHESEIDIISVVPLVIVAGLILLAVVKLGPKESIRKVISLLTTSKIETKASEDEPKLSIFGIRIR